MKSIISFIISILLSLPLYAQGESLFSMQFNRYGVDNGLPSNYISGLLQDGKGFIWIGTEKGLVRYDGIRFQTFNKKNSSALGLKWDMVTTLFQLGDEELWVGTSKGVYIYKYTTGRFQHFDPQPQGAIHIVGHVNAMTLDKDGKIWLATRGDGVYSYDTKTKKLKQYEMRHSNGYISHVLADSRNRIWLAGQNGTYRFNPYNDRFEEFRIQRESILSMTLYEDPSANIWIGTWNRGLLKIDPQGRHTSFLSPESPTQSYSLLHIRTIAEYKPGVLMIGSDDGLTFFDTHTLAVKRVNDKGKGEAALSDRFVYTLLKDREGGVWIGTFYNGVNYLPPYSGQFECYNRSFFPEVLNHGKVVSCFQEDHAGRVWVSFEDGGLECFSPHTRSFVELSGIKTVKDWSVQSFLLDGDEVWLATYERGLFRWNTVTGKIVPVKKGLRENDVFSLLKDRNGRIWVGTIKNFYQFDAQVDSLKMVKAIDDIVQVIRQDPKGRIWVGTYGKGIFSYIPDQDVWKQYTHGRGLEGQSVNSISFGRNGDMWIATSDGMYQYNQKKDRFDYISLGLPNEDVCSIVEDENMLWITTGSGLVGYNPESHKQYLFTSHDGLQTETFSNSAGLRTREGQIFVGTTDGFRTFFPDHLHHNEIRPPVVITGIEVYNKELSLAADSNILHVPMEYNMEKVVFPPSANMVSFVYAALSYCSPSKNQYAYMLEGFDKTWNYVGNQSKATYTNLPAGTYRFRVKATNNDGVWSEEGTSVLVTITPPWYRSVAFKILYVLLFCGVLYWLMHRYTRKSHRKHAIEIEKVKGEKDKELQEAKITFFTMIAHEIRTPVSLIIAPLESVLRVADTLPPFVRDNLNVMNRNSQRLLYLVNQLLDFRKVQENALRINFAPQSMKEVINAVAERFRPMMEQRGVRFTVEMDNKMGKADIDREAVTKLISNLLTNAAKYSKDEVTLSCYQSEDGQSFVVAVRDNGEGISEDDKAKIFMPFFQGKDNKPGTGIGLSIVKGIVDAHSGHIEVESAPGKGTAFIVTLPTRQQLEKKAREKKLDIIPDVEGDKPQPAPQDAVAPKPVMLLVDDNADMLQYLSTYFSSTYTVLTASDGVEALEVMENNEVSVVVSDWMMPRMDGVELIKKMRENKLVSHIPIVLLTARTDLKSKLEGLDVGADIYLEKPFSPQYLEACIKNLLEQRQRLKDKFSQMPLMPLKSIAGNKADERFLTQMNELIEQNLSNSELTVEFLAVKLGMSRSGFFAKVKTLSSITPNELIKLMRLKKAAQLLAEKEYRVGEVAYMVGFDNPSYFNECFRKQFGVTPGKFMQQEENKGKEAGEA